MNGLTTGKLAKRKIRDLTRIKQALEHLTTACDGRGPLSECPILEALSEDEPKHHHHH